MLANSCTTIVVCNPGGPSTPFATWWLILFDTIRSLCIVADVVVITQVPRALARCRTSAQRARFIAFALWALVVITTEAEHLGDGAGIRLALNVTATGYALWGMWGFRMETPGQDTERPNDT